MRNAWLTTFAALFCLVALAGASAIADPASMAIKAKKSPQQDGTKSLWPWSKKSEPAPQTMPPMLGTDRPTAHISATKHPIKYFTAAVSEMPIGKGKVASAPRPTMPPAQQRPDAISLSTPTGPPSPEFFIYAAQACERQNDFPQARANFQRALSIWPGQVEVLRAAARMEDRQGNLPLAENLYAQAVTANPQHAGARNDLGLCLARQGKLDASAQVLEQAVQLQPGKALYRNNAATVLVEMRQDQRALGHLAAVHGAAEANYNLGQLLVERNRAAEAAPYFQAALEQNPSMQPAQDALAKLQPASATQPTQPQVAQVTPPVTPAIAPVGQPAAIQSAPVTPPQYGYPTTAQAPSEGTQGSTPPRYLPPVASRPGEMRR
jgi:tetratricopeptide (TPR) repeat protein